MDFGTLSIPMLHANGSASFESGLEGTDQKLRDFMSELEVTPFLLLALGTTHCEFEFEFK